MALKKKKNRYNETEKQQAKNSCRLEKGDGCCDEQKKKTMI